MKNDGQPLAATEREQPTAAGVGRLRLFGEPCFYWQGQPYPLARRQPRALFYYLALQPQPMTRAALCRLFWPEEATVTALRRLTHVLDDLKRSLPTPELVVKSGETVSVNSAMLAVDTRTFRQLTAPTAAIQEWMGAVALYQAPLLSNFGLPQHPAFELWLLGERATWEARYLAVLARLVERQVTAGQWQSAIRHALLYLYSNATDETMHRTLIELYGRLGDHDAVRCQYRWCVSVLTRELGVQPSPVTEAAYTTALNDRRYL